MRLQKVVSAVLLCLLATAENVNAQAAVLETMDAASSTRSSATTAVATSADWITLRLNLRAGDVFRITDRTRDKSVEVTPETEQDYSAKTETVTERTQVSNYRVLYLHNDGAAQVRVSYGETKERVFVNGKPQSESSLRSMWPSVQVEMKIAHDGRISNVRGADKIMRAVIGTSNFDDFDDFDPEQRREMEQFFKAAFGEDMIKQLFEQMGMSFPQNPVRIGQPWFQRLQSKGLIPLTLNLKRTVSSRDSGVLNILDNGTVSMGDKTKITSFNDHKMRVALNGTFTGNTQIDENSGFTRAAFYTTRLSGTTTTYEDNAKPAVTRNYTLTTTRLGVQKLSQTSSTR